MDGTNVRPVVPALGRTLSSTIGEEWIGPYDQDIYSGIARPNETLQFDVDRTSATLDAYLRLYDANWTLLDGNDNGAAPGETVGADPFLRHTFTAGGPYWVVISGAGHRLRHDPRAVAILLGWLERQTP